MWLISAKNKTDKECSSAADFDFDYCKLFCPHTTIRQLLLPQYSLFLSRCRTLQRERTSSIRVGIEVRATLMSAIIDGGKALHNFDVIVVHHADM